MFSEQVITTEVIVKWWCEWEHVLEGCEGEWGQGSVVWGVKGVWESRGRGSEGSHVLRLPVPRAAVTKENK